MPNIIQFGGGGGAKIGVTLNEDGTQNVLLSDNGTVLDLAAGTADATATNEDVLEGKTFYAGGLKKTGTFVVPGPVLLWTNPDPSVAFPAQTISLDLSEYSGILVNAFNAKTAASQTFPGDGLSAPQYFEKGKEYPSETQPNKRNGLACIRSNTGGVYPNPMNSAQYVRGIAVTDTGVTFTKAIYPNNASGNDACVPYRIWGVKVTLEEKEVTHYEIRHKQSCKKLKV